MAFKFVKKLSIQWPVEVLVPADGGTTEKQEFTARFHILDETTFMKNADAAKDDKEFISGFLIGWSDLADEEGNEIPFSDDMRDQLVSQSYIKVAILKAYKKATNGIGDPATKN